MCHFFLPKSVKLREIKLSQKQVANEKSSYPSLLTVLTELIIKVPK